MRDLTDDDIAALDYVKAQIAAGLASNAKRDALVAEQADLAAKLEAEQSALAAQIAAEQADSALRAETLRNVSQQNIDAINAQFADSTTVTPPIFIKPPVG